MIDIIAVGSLLLAIVGMAIYYVLEMLTFFRILSINMVAVGYYLWPAIYVCLGISACLIVLSFFKRNR